MHSRARVDEVLTTIGKAFEKKRKTDDVVLKVSSRALRSEENRSGCT